MQENFVDKPTVDKSTKKNGILNNALHILQLTSLIKPIVTNPVNVQNLDANGLAIGNNLQANNHNMVHEIYPYTQIQDTEAHVQHKRNIQPKFQSKQSKKSYLKATLSCLVL